MQRRGLIAGILTLGLLGGMAWLVHGRVSKAGGSKKESVGLHLRTTGVDTLPSGWAEIEDPSDIRLLLLGDGAGNDIDLQLR